MTTDDTQPVDQQSSLDRTIERSREIEAELKTNPSAFRVLTGDRPTGDLHIGHYFGSLITGCAFRISGYRR